ncbi:hypothetical protein CJJ09_000015 [Candidozyma auris]|nr:hypothetical protein CJJ09_000015 [[Candida] auris]
MSSNKPGTPISSPRIGKQVKLDVPSTPPAAKGKKRPGLKRTSSGMLKSPDYKLNSTNDGDPSILKTPKNSGYDSDERDTPRKSKLVRTPQFFSPGKRLFTDENSPNKQELAEISSQLKSRLSSALGKVKGQDKDKSQIAPVKLDFSDQSFTPPQDSEQDAVYSLMSLSSPQKLHDSRGHSRQQSQNTNSTQTSRSSSVVNTVLPPISGIMKNVDNDETDIEESTMSEGEESS